MGTLESRVEKLEQLSPLELKTIFIVLVGMGKVDVPVLGWRFQGNDRHQVCVMREPDETDDSLRSRTLVAARKARPGCTQLFIPVTDHDHD